MPQSPYDDYVRFLHPRPYQNLAPPPNDVRDTPPPQRVHHGQGAGWHGHDVAHKNPQMISVEPNSDSGANQENLRDRDLEEKIRKLENTIETLQQDLAKLETIPADESGYGSPQNLWKNSPSQPGGNGAPIWSPRPDATPPLQGRQGQGLPVQNHNPKAMPGLNSPGIAVDEMGPRMRFAMSPPIQMHPLNGQFYVGQQQISDNGKMPMMMLSPEQIAEFCGQPEMTQKKGHKKHDRSCDKKEKISKEDKGKKKKKDKNLKKVSLISSPEGLKPIGKFKTLKDNDLRKYIRKYVQNSSGIDADIGEVVIHDILRLSKPIACETEGLVLLCCQTNPKTVAKLAATEDGEDHFLFHDRLAPAFAEDPSNLLSPMRQLLLLCAVDLGKMHKTTESYDEYWSQGQPIPEGYDSVKGFGRLTIDSKGNREVGDVVIPCGDTIENGKYAKSPLEYNEYIVNDLERIYVRYAVDLEIVPVEGSQ